VNENIRDFEFQQEQTVDYKALLFKFYHHWPLFAGAVVMTLVFAFFFNKYAKPEYELKTTVLIKDKSENKLDAQDLLGMGLMNSMQNIQNEIGILSSYNLIYRAVRKTGGEVAYYSTDKFRFGEFFSGNPIGVLKRYYNGNPFSPTVELYKESPFRVIMDTTHRQPVGMKFSVTLLSPYKFRIEAEDEEVSLYDYSLKQPVPGIKGTIAMGGIYAYGQEIQSKDFKFRIVPDAHFTDPDVFGKSYYFIFCDYETLVNQFRSFTIEPIKKEASIVEIKLKGPNPSRQSDFLNSLTSEYLNRGLENKNVVATRTIDFIDNELEGISDSLGLSEKALMTFRTSKEIMNLDDESRQVFDKMMQLQDEKAVLLIKTNYLLNMKEYIERNQKLDELVVPSSMGIDNQVLNTLTLQLTQLYMKRSENAQFSKEKNPSLISIDNQIAATKSALYENVNSAINSNELAMKEIKGRVAEINARINNLPETQRVLFGIERKFKLIDATYTYLLQKRSEAQITRAANLSDNEVIDEARTTGLAPVFPKKSLNYMIALILGFVLPILYILGREYFNSAIISREDVEKITDLPVIGQVIHNSKPGNMVVINSPKSTGAEAFRTVRTNINYLLQGKERQTILVTSDMVGAGKTFVSINLASVFALFGKKTLLMGFDLRKPKIYEDFELNNKEGITSYLVGKSNMEAIIQHSNVANLDIIMAGPIPPNPSELIASEKCAKMFTKLKDIYEYIIIDTPPVGLVTDALLLMKHADANLFLVRQGETHKKIFASVIGDLEKREIPHLAILINDIKLDKGSYGYGYNYGYGYGKGYGYGYGYGYGHGYYSDDEEKIAKKNFFERLFRQPKHNHRPRKKPVTRDA